MRFETPSGTTVTRQRAGLRTQIDSGALIDDHSYVQVFDLGRVR